MSKPLVVFVWMLSVLCTGFSNPSFAQKIEFESKGARVKEDLSAIVFSAVKLNDFQILMDLIPDDTELNYFISHTNKKNESIYAKLDRMELVKNTQINFEKLEEEGIQSGINWSTVQLVDNIFIEGNFSDKRIYKGILMLQDDSNREIKISFDIIKIKNGWFLFQGIRIEK